MQTQPNVSQGSNAPWIPISRSMVLLFSRKKLLGLSLLLFLATIGFTWLGYLLTVDFIDGLTGSFLSTAPATDTVWGWIKHKGWVVAHWLFLIVSRIVAFYLSFLLAYTLTNPGYTFLSSAAEKIHAGDDLAPDAEFSVAGVLRDLLEGVKIALFGLVVTAAALLVNFIPGVGQIAVILLYSYYATLMFIDFPASRRRWSLGRKLAWLRTHNTSALRIGVLPALLSIIPVVNIFVIALLFPVLTVHATLNFSAIEIQKKIKL